jgi:two-component system nitrate/nitrite response regulator NarL
VNGPIRVLVADDHPVYVDGLAAAIARTADLELAGTCEDAATALRAIRADPPDVAVVDLRMPGMTTEELLQELAGEGLDVAVLILSVHVGGEEVHECLSLGAAGYVAKEADRAEICEAIRRVARGRVVLSTAVQTSMAAELRERRHDEKLAVSDRAAAVAEGLRRGLIA